LKAGLRAERVVLIAAARLVFGSVPASSTPLPQSLVISFSTDCLCQWTE